MIKACIFDLDGTLADTVESMAFAANRALARVGYPPLPSENFKYYAGDGAKTLMERVLQASGDVKLKHLDQAYEIYSEFFKKDCTYKVTVYDGIFDLIHGLKERGIKITVLSNKPHARSVDVINKLFGPGVFDHVQGQTEEVPKKPSPAGALMTARMLGVEPEECMYIGDTNVDMKTGNAAGMFTVGVLWGFRTQKELEENQAHHIVSRPEEILEMVDRFNYGIPSQAHIRLVVSDIDGTLLKEGETKLPEGIVEAANALMDRGISFAVASGRQLCSIEKLFAGLKYPVYIISENGGQVSFDGKRLDFKAFSGEDYRAVVRAVRDYDSSIPMMMAGIDDYFVDAKDKAFEKMIHDMYFYTTVAVDDLEQLEAPVCKIAARVSNHGEDAAKHFREMFGARMEVAVSGEQWVDFNPVGADKGTALKLVQKFLGVSGSETVAFADNQNDVTMLECAEYSFAVANALPAAKRAARYRTDNVCRELEKLAKAR